MFVINNTLITPPLSDSILDGVTRDSLLQLAHAAGISTEERQVSIDELEKAFLENTITEAFGAGTAAVVAPIKSIYLKGRDWDLPAYNSKSIHEKIKLNLSAIRTGRVKDLYNWNYIV